MPLFLKFNERFWSHWVNHPRVMSISCQPGINEVNINQPGLIQGQKSISGQNTGNQGRNLWKLKALQLTDALKVTITW